MSDTLEKAIARDLLSIGAVFLRPEQPFTWASGIHSPIYCDNRLILSAPAVRDRVEAGLDGVVCSPLEASLVKAACGPKFLAVTPGIRFADAATDDQVRITTPARAREIGSDFIVVGRPITAAADPHAAWRRCLAEFCPETL